MSNGLLDESFRTVLCFFIPAEKCEVLARRANLIVFQHQRCLRKC